jgi:maltoporin
VVDPGFTEYYFWNSSAAGAGVYTVQVGFIVELYNP